VTAARADSVARAVQQELHKRAVPLAAEEE
jgi:hypothetical protein